MLRLPKEARKLCPKLKTRDQWWEKASRKERADVALAYFVERSGLFEISEPKGRDCATCAGTGLIKRGLANGKKLVCVCPRCQGTGRDQVVRYR